MSTVNNLGWETFIKHRSSYSIPIVREFYVGIHDSKEGKPLTYSMVKKVRVHFDPRSINDEYHLGYNGQNFERRVETYGKKEMEKVKGRIVEKDDVWKKLTNTEFKPKRIFLKNEAGTWFNFIAHYLLPTCHTYSLTKERFTLLDAILTNSDIDVGRIISKEILMCKNKGVGYLFFPCLITNLCVNAGVTIKKEKVRKGPQSAYSAEFKEKPKHAGASRTATIHAAATSSMEISEGALSQLVEPPTFPTWVLGTEEEGEEEKEEESGEERKTKLVEKIKGKKKKTVITEEEPLLSPEDLEETIEEEEASKAMKDMGKNDDEEDTETKEYNDENENLEEIIMEEAPGKKYNTKNIPLRPTTTTTSPPPQTQTSKTTTT